ncbi:MAG: hypothetical protein A4E67_02216 [Syntrophaceae bacterium PtaB.Bin038]|nr:MAG: hypothetical protein A4E67_02216 [Syntrophaceae bacterium PtaB.Bin038]
MYYTAFCVKPDGGIATVNFEATATSTEAIWQAARLALAARIGAGTVVCWTGWTTPALRMDALREGKIMQLPKAIGRG